MSWSRRDFWIAIGILVASGVVFHLFRSANGYDTFFPLYLLLWLSMFVTMIAWPLGLLWKRGLLARPKVTRVLKEVGIAIPVALGLLVAESWLVVALGRVSGGAVEVGSSLAPLRNAPNDPRLYLLLIPAFTLGPIAEELLFRGLLYNALRQRMGVILAVVLQAAIFALEHYRAPYHQVAELILVFALGVIFAGVYEWRRTLWAPISVHCLQNLAFAGPLIVLMILNSHTPASTWQEARVAPEWLNETFLPIEQQGSAEAQRLYAINTWGSRGLHLWKQEVRALKAVCDWFPGDSNACATARSGIAMIYRVYLKDPRRAIVESDYILQNFGDQSESCAQALLVKGWAYFDIEDYRTSRESFQELARSYPSIEWVPVEVSRGLKELDGK